jgi:LacI family transcriptional regulator
MPESHTQRVTLQDVAREAGVSRTTASFVLTGRLDMRVAPDTKERVLQIARQLDYRPNLVARSLRTNRPVSLGLICDGAPGDLRAGGIVSVSVRTAAANHQLMVIGEVGAGGVSLSELAHEMLDRGVGAFLYVANHARRIEAIPSILLEHPLVLVNCITDQGGIPMVVPDEFEAGRTAGLALLSNGHTDRIVVVGETPPGDVAATRRRAGLLDVLGRTGREPAGELPSGWEPEPARSMVRQAIGEGMRPSAFVCLNDRIALGVYRAIADVGLLVPDDVSVIAFDDSALADWLVPGLTGVAVPYAELGRRGVELLLDPTRAGGPHLVPMPLRSRGSIGPP